MGATQPLPDETPSLVPPARVPPVTAGAIPPSGGAGGRSFSLRRFRILAVVLMVCGAGSIAIIPWAITQRPPTLLVALLFVATGLLRRRRAFRSPTFDFLTGEIYYWSIAGGVVGELVAQLALHIDPGAPTSWFWLVLGAGGIGGACGIGIGILCSLAVTGLLGGWKIWRTSASAA